MAEQSIADELHAIAKCTHHEDDALAFLEDNYDVLRAALSSAAEIERLVDENAKLRSALDLAIEGFEKVAQLDPISKRAVGGWMTETAEDKDKMAVAYIGHVKRALGDAQ